MKSHRLVVLGVVLISCLREWGIFGDNGKPASDIGPHKLLQRIYGPHGKVPQSIINECFKSYDSKSVPTTNPQKSCLTGSILKTRRHGIKSVNLHTVCPDTLNQLLRCVEDTDVHWDTMDNGAEGFAAQGGGGRKEVSIGNSTKSKKDGTIQTKVWVASCISIFIISLVGLAGVAVVPLVQKEFYNYVIQFLVALAVGTLTGDAFLHLLPHAIVESVEGGEDADMPEHDHESHEQGTVFKGLAALGGVYFFFIAEKIVMIVSQLRVEKKADDEDKTKAVTSGPRKSDTRRMSAVALAQQQPGGKNSAMLRRMSRAMSSTGEDVMTTGLSSRAMKSIDNLIIRKVEAGSDGEDECNDMSDNEDRKKSITLTIPGVTVNQGNSDTEDKEGEDIIEPAVTLVVPGVGQKADGHSHDEESGPPEKKAHGHGHGHGHNEVPESIAAVAMMVILGDGLHNFSDGLAIGAAFANSIAGGLSTAVAVFCHELPHELGDFAVLLKTGMRVKEALFYNCLSSILCFIGMCIGVALGNIESLSYWIFAVVGGMFIYISLVDMLPELSSAEVRPGESRLLQFALQNAGLFTGASIMLLIALFEEKIRNIFDPKLFE